MEEKPRLTAAGRGMLYVHFYAGVGMARLGVAALLAVRHRAQERMRPIRLGMAELGHTASIQHMTAWQRPYALVPRPVQNKGPSAHGTDRRLVRQRHNRIVVPGSIRLHIDGRLLETLRERWHGGVWMCPRRIEACGYRLVGVGNWVRMRRSMWPQERLV